MLEKRKRAAEILIA